MANFNEDSFETEGAADAAGVLKENVVEVAGTTMLLVAAEPKENVAVGPVEVLVDAVGSDPKRLNMLGWLAGAVCAAEAVDD